MKKLFKFIGWTFVLLMSMAIINGCDDNWTRSITIEYLPGSEEIGWVKDVLGKTSPSDRPTIALNHFSDERGTDDTVGAVYSRSGQKVETLVTAEKPADILEKALIRQLEKAGFKVIATSGWDLTPETIPGYLNADFILGGRIKAFWVESRAGFLRSTINSEVAYDLIIADARNKRILWTGRISGHDTKKSLAHTNDYFWADLQSSMNKSLTQAVNGVFHDEQARRAIITLIRIKF